MLIGPTKTVMTERHHVVEVEVAVFQEKLEGAKGLNLPCILEETRLLDKYMEIITRAVHEKRCIRKFRLKLKSDFLI